MRCLLCSHPETKVVETRECSDSTRRRRECLDCKSRFTTYERVEQELIVVKKDGRKEKFDAQKLLKGVQRACNKRPVSEEQIAEIVKSVERHCLEQGWEIETRQVGEAVMQHLSKVDEVSYIRFASVYREFDDPASFAKEIDHLKKLKQKKEGIAVCRL